MSNALETGLADSVFVDQSALAAFMNADDARHAKARSVFYDLDDLDRHLVTTNYVMFDIHQWLTDEYDYELAHLFLATIDKAADQGKLDILSGEAALEHKAKQFITEFPNYHFSLSEAATIVIMLHYEIKRIFTFNPNFAIIPKLRQDMKVIPSLW